MRPRGSPYRGSRRILRLIPHYTVYDGTIHRAAIHGLRIHVEGHEPDRPLRSLHALLRRRYRRWICGGAHHSARCHQDTITNTRKCQRRRVEERLRPLPGGQDNPSKGGL
eukprot:Amastigsp_a348023_3.p2 type:complete len:110 gc:universal Amastigsp_a348023_3:97-426(+)